MEVSILARPEGRALLAFSFGSFLMHQFQSSPAPKGGRYGHSPPPGLQYIMFQSSPAPKGGRYASRQQRVQTPSSFNPRPPRRAGATLNACADLAMTWCFNPRPPRRAGATRLSRLGHHNWSVSILARPEGRALPTYCVYTRSLSNVSILARPEGRALPTTRCGMAATPAFQSSPAPKGGRYS